MRGEGGLKWQETDKREKRQGSEWMGEWIRGEAGGCTASPGVELNRLYICYMC